jgi:hypothetical protein
MQNKVCLQAFSFGGSNDILKEAVVSDFLRNTKIEWWQHYRKCERSDDASTNLPSQNYLRACLRSLSGRNSVSRSVKCS